MVNKFFYKKKNKTNVELLFLSTQSTHSPLYITQPNPQGTMGCVHLSPAWGLLHLWVCNTAGARPESTLSKSQSQAVFSPGGGTERRLSSSFLLRKLVTCAVEGNKRQSQMERDCLHRTNNYWKYWQSLFFFFS